jgi:MraZ protein
MARFFGRFEHSLDTKGRLILPARFRMHFEHGGYLTQYLDRCLALWTPENFEKQMNQMETDATMSREARNLARLWAAGTVEIEVDKQGRLPIAPYLREFGRLDGPVLVHGAIDRVELWNPEQWATKVQPSSRQLTEDEDDV